MGAAPGTAPCPAGGGVEEGRFAGPHEPPGVYLHVPFCARVCPYCDFAVQTGGPEKRRRYLEALGREIEGWAAGLDGWSGPRGAAFDTVYLGGGTPSALAPHQLEEMLVALRRRLPVAAGAEVTLEANPEDVTAGRLADWRALGVTRLSLGVQSFDDAALQRLGRRHTAAAATAAVEAALAGGFAAVSVDLIFALPQQGARGWRSALQRAVELRPHHISCYELTVHEGTRLFRERDRGRFIELPDDDKAALFFFTHRFLADAGFAAYEVSNFARGPEHRSRHNGKYWRHAPYLGLGPAAHSFDGRRRRWWNERRLATWSAALAARRRPIAGTETLTREQLVLEALALGLRTTGGVDLERLARRWGIELGVLNAERIAGFEADGLLQPASSSVLVPTLRGMALADTLAGALRIPPPAAPPG